MLVAILDCFFLYHVYLSVSDTHTHSILTAIFPGEPGLAGCPLNLFCHLFLNCTSFWDRRKISISSLTQSHQLLCGCPFCPFPSASDVIQRLTQSLSSLCSTCPNHLNLLFLIIKQTGSNAKSFLSSSLFLSFSLIPHVHLSANGHKVHCTV